MPFALVIGAEAILPLEVQMLSFRIVVIKKIIEEPNVKLILEELEGLE